VCRRGARKNLDEAMPAVCIKCPNPKCGEPVDYWAVHCRRCEWFVGFPNYRAAEAERDDLQKRYENARADANNRKIARLLDKLESLAERSRPVINMSFATCDDILRARKYRNYDQRVSSSEREPAEAQHHADRSMVGDRLCPMYKEHIQYAALSPDGRGLSSYGPVAVRWDVLPNYLEQRISLIEENSFTFYDQHELGRLDATIPAGCRAIWEDRAKLAAAKLAARLTTATAESSLPGLLMHAGATRKDDEFVEIFIFADKGLETREVDLVTIERAPMTAEESHRRKLIWEVCAARSNPIRVIE
jgi:hypothetical protein